MVSGLAANLTAAAYDEADWRDPDPEVIDAVATLLGVLAPAVWFFTVRPPGEAPLP